jgi:HEAT repeat protein
MRRRFLSAVMLSACALGVFVVGCHPNDNDPKGQAGDLNDPVRREYALGRLQSIYSTRLSAAKGDRTQAPVKEFVDETHDPLTKAYLEHPEDTQNGLRILSLMNEMRDARVLPALIKAMDWTAEVSEDHAVTAALTMTEIDIPPDKRGDVVASVGKALLRVDGARGADNRMRKSFIEVLGKLKDKRASDTLTKIALKRDASQNFLFNILAAQQLVAIADPTTIPTFIKALYWFDVNNPAMRMNDVATSGLVAIGKPALEPLLKVLRGEDEEANAIVKLYIESIKQKDAEASRKLNPRAIVSTEATFTLGKLGFREALQPLIAESKEADSTRAMGAALALVSIVRTPEDTPLIVDALTKTYTAMEMAQRPQLLVAMRHLYAPELMPFFLNTAKTKLKDFGSDAARLYAFQGYALLANKSEMAQAKLIYDKDDLLKAQLADHAVLFAAAAACDSSAECWTGKLKDNDKLVLRKASSMLARYGRGDDKAIHALVQLFSHRDLEVRNEALGAVDAIAVKGSKEAVDKIDELETVEGGRSIWNNFKREALPTRSRLQLRTAG